MLLRLNTIGAEVIDGLAPSFNYLPETEHLDGKYRLRRYSVVQCNGNRLPSPVGDNTFTQSDEYNKFQGNVTRQFEPIEPSVLNSIDMGVMCSMFKDMCRLPANQKINIHQMRIITLEDETPVSPEGIHQDGYDYICVVGVNRYNVTGGHFLAYLNRDDEPFMSLPLKPKLMVAINDRALWHNATKIKPVLGKDGYMDSFILTARIDDGIN